jgi:hypothetical protein
MKILFMIMRSDYTVSVAQHDHDTGSTVSVGLVGASVLVSFPTVGERTIEAGYWEVTGKIADYIAHAANRAHREPSKGNINDFLKVLGYYLPVKEEIVTVTDAESRASECGDKSWQVATRYHCEWFGEVLHKIGAHCGAYYMSDVPRLVLETVKEAQEEIERRKEVLSPNPPIRPTLAAPKVPHPRSMEFVRR